ncbi:PAS domain S-box protein [Oleidesulfovibrio sp.]|uniref:PAS domain S-box protein n=1 Tax=Oleidesulfovibrio sp. TaxID=2909707 RepID=UPI003A84A572
MVQKKKTDRLDEVSASGPATQDAVRECSSAFEENCVKTETPSALESEDTYQKLVGSLIGLGEKSFRKSYYPQLRRKITDLEVFQHMVDSASDAILLMRVGPPHQIDYLNKAAKEVLGLDTACKQPVDPLSFLDKRVVDIMQGCAGASCSKRLTLTVAVHGGGERILEASVSPMPATGQPPHVIMLIRDVTAREKAEQHLRESEERFRVVFEQSMQHVVLLQPDGRVQRVNRSVLDDFSVTLQSLQGQYVWDAPWLITDELKSSLKQDVNSAAVGATVRRLYHTPDGTYDCSFKPVRDSDGEIIHVVVEARDITALLEAESESRRLRDLLTNVVDSMPSVLVAVEADGCIVQWNKEAERVTGITAERAKGLHILEALGNYPSLAELVRVSIAERRPLVESKVARAEKSGRIVYEDLIVYPLGSEGHEGAVIRIDDVSERVLMEQTMVQAEKMLSVGGLAAGMAHEINNPLGAIMQGLQNVVRRLDPDNAKNLEYAKSCGLDMGAMTTYLRERKIYRMFSGMREASLRAAGIVSNMLTFSRKSDMSHSSCSVEDMLEDTLVLAETDYDLKKSYDFKSIKIVKEYQSVPLITCNKTEVEQVLLNLLRNAAQAFFATGPEGVLPDGSRKMICHKPVITIRTRRDDRYVYVEIQDNGPGMSEDVQKRVFEPFFTTKPPGVGTGLGLSVSYFIITRNHKGSMVLDSAPGRGSRFTVGLPLNDNDVIH